MKATITYLVLLFVALALYMLSVRAKEKVINWQVTLNSNDKIPFGAYIFRKELPRLFPRAKVEDLNSAVYSAVQKIPKNQTLLFFANTYCAISKTDQEALFAYVANGNQVFIAASFWENSIQEKYHLRVHFPASSQKESYAYFKAPSVNKKFTSDRQILYSYFDRFDSTKAEVLGYCSVQKPNFLRFKIGKGFLYVHSNPKIFSNYFLLQHDNSEYVARAFSLLEPTIKQVYWDEYYSTLSVNENGTNREKRSVLSFIISDSSLHTAYLGTLILLLLFVLFEVKRRQRIIPIIEPIKNQTLAFVETMGSLYFNQKNNQDIANKMALQLLEFIQLHYFMSTQQQGEEFILLLEAKSGLDKDFLYSLFSMVTTVQNPYQFLSDESLIRFNEKIETFYSTANK